MSTILSEPDTILSGVTPTGKKPLDQLEFRARLNQRLGQLDIERERWRPHWRDLQRYILPEHGFNLQGLSGEEQRDGGKKRFFIIDDTASLAVDVFAAGMQSGMTSPSRPWFRLRLEEPELNDFLPVKLWLSTVEELVYRIFSRSNFYGSVHQGYSELGVFGTWAQLIDEDYDTIIRCRPFTCGEFWLALDSKLRIEAFYRRLWMNAAQMVEEFGKENCSTAVQSQYENSQLVTLFEVIQAIELNDDRYYVPQCKGKKYRSAYFERSTSAEQLLRIKGYEELPVQCPRWAVIGGKTYGTSRGMLSLGNVKMLQKLNQKQLENLDKAVDPPLVAPTSMKNDNIFTLPAGVNFTDDLSPGNNGMRPLFQVQNYFDVVQKKIESVQEQLNVTYFVDLFKAISQYETRSNVTAVEIAQRHEEVLLILGPVIERLGTELLSPSIERTLAIAQRLGILPPPPKVIAGLPLHIEYVSILAQAQKMVGTGALQQFVAFCANIAQVFGPQVLDSINSDAVVLLYGEMTGIDPRTLNSTEVVSALRQQRQKAMQQQQQMQQAGMLAQGAKTLADTSTGPGTALSELMGRLNPSPVPAAA
jgi:hypothetical protein